MHEPQNACAVLEKRRADGECELHSEVTDGVYTVRDGAETGLEPAQSCRTMTGSFRTLSVCEPWWKRERVYKCKGEEPDLSQIKERAEYVASNIGYDENADKWLTQGDLTFRDGGKEQTVYDPQPDVLTGPRHLYPGLPGMGKRIRLSNALDFMQQLAFLSLYFLFIIIGMDASFRK